MIQIDALNFAEFEISRFDCNGEKTGLTVQLQNSPDIGLPPIALAVDDLWGHPIWRTNYRLHARRATDRLKSLARAKVGKLHVAIVVTKNISTCE